MTALHPRVLVLAANEITADFSTGITVVNLFKGWPAERLAQVCIIPSTSGGEPLTTRTVTLPFNGGIADIPVRWGLRRLRSLRASTRTGSASDATPSLSTTSATPGALATLLEMGPVRLSVEARRLVDEFRPDVIYAPISGIRMMRLARQLSRTTGAPVVPHFLDDWPTTLHRGGLVGRWARRVLGIELRATLAETTTIGVISAAMGDEYRVRYGVDTVPLMNCVETLSTPPSPRPEPVRFAYVGGLHLGRAAVLRTVAEALDAAGGAELVVHAPSPELDQHGRAFHDLASVTWGPSLRAEDVSTALAAADVLVHLESFDQATVDYTRLSISTKIPQYLSAARPILAVGPPTLASMRHLSASGAAELVPDIGSPTLQRAVNSLIDDPGRRAAMGASGVRFASVQHHGPAVRERLRALLCRPLENPARTGALK